METSDSECFESADEEFLSDNEDKNVKTTTKHHKVVCIEPKDVALNIGIQQSNKRAQENLKQKSQGDGDDPSDKPIKDEKNSTAALQERISKPERKNKPVRSALGVKLDRCTVKPSLNTSLQTEVYESERFNSNNRVVKPTVEDINTADTACLIGPKEISNFNSLHLQESPESTNVKSESKTCNINKLPQSEDKEENMWEDDDWDPIPDESIEEKTEITNSNEPIIPNKTTAANEDHFGSNWSSWGNWGVTSLLSTATMGVTSVTNQVSQSFMTALENGMGVPRPEELAQMNNISDAKFRVLDHSENKNPASGNVSESPFGLGSFVSSVSQITKLVETTGNKVISSGLDTLETIGKKTMEVLQEGDPGLKKKRAFLKIETDKPVLSQILREAKTKAETENKLLEERHFSKKANYETLFDDHQGLVHLEALEMLSKQCDIKLQNLLEMHTGAELVEMQETLSQIKELCELSEDDEDQEINLPDVREKLDLAATEMNITISYTKLISTWVESEEWLQNLNLNVCNDMELHEQSINILAQLTAVAVELFHKTGELLLIKDHRSTVDEADSLVQLTNTITMLIGNVAKSITDKLSEKASNSRNTCNINELMTNIYYEATNSNSYIKDAFHLLIPVLQVGAV